MRPLPREFPRYNSCAPPQETRHGVSIASRTLRVAVSLAIVAGVGGLCASIRHVHSATASLFLLLAILVIASRWGFIEAAAATGFSAAILAYFFLPPNGLRIKSPEHWIVFFTFLAVALLTARVAALAKRRTAEAIARQRDLERQHTFGQDLTMEGQPGAAVAASLDSMVRSFEIDGAAFCDCGTGEITSSGPKASFIAADQLRAAAGYSDLFMGKIPGSMFLPIHCGGQVIGTLAVHGDMSEFTFRAIADRIETGLDKVYAHEEVRHAEEARRSQDLKTAVLDSLVHEVKTPLSVIKTAASSLLSRDSDPLSRQELLTIINEEADRMDASISEVFRTARVEAGTLQLGKGPNNLGLLITEVLNELRPLLASRSVSVEVPDSLPPVTCDFQMIKGVLKELLTNAVKYSPSDSPLTIWVQQVGDEITINVGDSGIGIAAGEEKLIFEKHYRGRAQRPGTGLGLAIAKTIVEAHGGRIGIMSQPNGGSVFHFSLPVSDSGQTLNLQA